MDASLCGPFGASGPVGVIALPGLRPGLVCNRPSGAKKLHVSCFCQQQRDNVRLRLLPIGVQGHRLPRRATAPWPPGRATDGTRPTLRPASG